MASGASRRVLSAATAQLLGPDDAVVGSGFLIAADVLVTCAHVVEAAGGRPGKTVAVRFPNVPERPRTSGRVVEDAWRASHAEDIAVVRLVDPPPEVPVLGLGAALGGRGHPVVSFGFPVRAPEGGHFGEGRAGELLDAFGGLLQLSQANDLARGFSGAPLLDESTGLVVGMVAAITSPDAQARGTGIAYATPTEALCAVWPDLNVEVVNPYRGLEAFTAEDTAFFHGRDAAGERLLTTLRWHRRVLLLGPSGAGKTSLLQAKLLPDLLQGVLPGSARWRVVYARPGLDPAAELDAAGLPGVAAHGLVGAVRRLLDDAPEHDHVLVVIDQTEEALSADGTACGLEVLGDLGPDDEEFDRLTVLFVLRDDFYSRLASHAPELMEAVGPGVVHVPATLDRAELDAIISAPAAAVGVRFEEGLVARIITDLLAADPEGRRQDRTPVTLLPMLEAALTRLWHERTGHVLTHRAYEAMNRVTGGLAAGCEAALHALSDDHRPLARRLLTALVQPGDAALNTPATRRRLTLAELRENSGAVPGGSGEPPVPGGRFEEVLNILVRHRVVVTATPRTVPGGTSTAELVHEALIRDWPRLRDWVAADGEFQRWLQRTDDRYRRWRHSGRKEDLLAGTELDVGLFALHDRGLPARLAEFVDASRRRQLRDQRRRQIVVVVLTTLLVLALVAAGIAAHQQHAADEARVQTEHARLAAVSRQLAAQSVNLLPTDPDVAGLLAIQAYRYEPTQEARNALYAATAVPLQRQLEGMGFRVQGADFSPDGRLLTAWSSESDALWWDPATGARVTELPTHATSAGFDPSGRTVATASVHGVVELWEVPGGTLLGLLPVEADRVAFSPDGRVLGTLGDDGIARLWDPVTRLPLTEMHGRGEANSLTFSPDSRTLLTAGLGEPALLWDVPTGRLLGPLGGAFPEQAFVQLSTTPVFSPDGRAIGTIDEEQVPRLWDARTGRLLRELADGEDRVRTIAFSPDGKRAATGGEGTIRVWDAFDGRPLMTLRGHTGAVEAVAFSPDGTLIASAAADGTAALWDAASGARLVVFRGHWRPVTVLAFSPDGETLATGSDDNTVRLWDTRLRPERDPLVAHTDTVTGVSVVADDAMLVSTDASTMRVWDLRTGALRTALPGAGEPRAGVRDMAVSGDGRLAATTAPDEAPNQAPAVWDTRTGVRLREFPAGGSWMSVAAFSHDGTRLAVSDDAGLRLWDTTTGAELLRVTVSDFDLHAAELSRDGRFLAVGGETTTVWDTTTGRLVLTLGVGDNVRVTDAEFSPDGRTVAVADDEGVVRVADTATGRLRDTLRAGGAAVRGVRFSPDGRTLATVGDGGSAALWNTADGSLSTRLTGHRDEVHHAVFSPDGRTVATAGFDGTIRVWEASTGENLAVLTGHVSTVSALAVTPDGREWVSGGLDGTVRLWPIGAASTSEAVDEICAMVRRDFFATERRDYLGGESTAPVCPRGDWMDLWDDIEEFVEGTSLPRPAGDVVGQPIPNHGNRRSERRRLAVYPDARGCPGPGRVGSATTVRPSAGDVCAKSPGSDPRSPVTVEGLRGPQVMPGPGKEVWDATPETEASAPSAPRQATRHAPRRWCSPRQRRRPARRTPRRGAAGGFTGHALSTLG